jgi:site-specific DNA recombinase
MKHATYAFDQFGKKPVAKRNKSDTQKLAVMYTRVSSKEQFETNLSLDWQKKAIEEYAERTGFTIDGHFGGIYESASNDARKEFQKMLTYVKQNKRVTHILVYLLDRFSRTGGGAIKLAHELREKYGVNLIAVTQPIDTTNPGGVFQQNIQLLISEYDNQLRRQRTVAGLTENLRRGNWCLTPPIGYETIYDKTNMMGKKGKGIRKIVISEDGKKIKKAFEWKANGMKDTEILAKLKLMGLKGLYPQKLSYIFNNPFYCGKIVSELLNGEIVEGIHEKLISPALFLKVNGIKQARGGKLGVRHNKEFPTVPLKSTIHCCTCNRPFAGYIVRAKNLWYYKCPTKGCRKNISATKANSMFYDFLGNYKLSEKNVPVMKMMLSEIVNGANKEQKEDVTLLKDKLKTTQKKIDELNSKFYLDGAIPEEVFEKFIKQLSGERNEYESKLRKIENSNSNLENAINYATKIALKLPEIWRLSDFGEKEKLQKLLFPNGIKIDVQNSTFRTEQVNKVFEYIALQQRVSSNHTNKKTDISVGFSSQVGTTRFELATPSTPY